MLNLNKTSHPITINFSLDHNLKFYKIKVFPCILRNKNQVI